MSASERGEEGGGERVGAERSGIYVGRKGGEQWADRAIMGPVLTHLGQFPID